MAGQTFREMLDQRGRESDSLVCVGLDPQPERLGISPDASDDEVASAIVAFNRTLISATAPFALAFKPNLAFYLPFGGAGVEALIETRRMVPAGIPVILDAKANDMGNTAERYAAAYLDRWGFDAVTVNAYLGEEGMAPFLSRSGKGLFVLARTSNPGSDLFQELRVGDAGQPLYEWVTALVNQWDARFPADTGLVVGATRPEELVRVRAIAPDLPILLPGVGAQGGDVEASVRAGCDPRGGGLLVHAGRSIMYAGEGDDAGPAAAEAARALRDEINRYRPGCVAVA